MDLLSVGALPAPAASPAALTLLYERHYATVHAFACRRSGDPARADDITADTFVQAWQALPRYEERGRPIVVWLLRIAAHVAADQERRQRRVAAGSAVSEALRGVAVAAAGPEALVERREQSVWLQGHLAQLAPAQRSALWLRYVDALPVADVARQLGKSPGATKQLLHRALLQLRAQLQDEDAWVSGRPCCAGCRSRPAIEAGKRRQTRAEAADTDAVG